MNQNKLNIAIIGLGYVGLPLAVEFSKKYRVLGFDIDQRRISELKQNFDRTNELSKEDFSLNKNRLNFTSSTTDLNKSNIYIITVPTPVDDNNSPNLSPLINATKMIGKVLSKDDIVIYESTVYPGCTEEICVPILQKESNLTYNEQFFCGYSPERINPGDKKHTLTKILKITSGSNFQTAEYIDQLYRSIIPAGTYKTSSIIVAEAAKVIENTQRDLNIALINELSVIFNKLNLDTIEVLEAAGTKWNFLPFRPGLVGGHCIGVDPYYLTHKALEVGYEPKVILSGREINDGMGKHIVENTISELDQQGVPIDRAEISILGLTFKENCPDIRNTKVISIYKSLEQYNCKLIITDEWADYKEVKSEFGVELKSLNDIKNQDAIILAVGHKEYSNFNRSDWMKMLKPEGVLIDIKSLYNKETFSNENIRHWRL
ncbi:MAG: Vi polysaccharide biosynthesis protein VipA/TviB [Candidatus Marinimicrobia bacterium]|nr:Vi polysaccharide biosynthesis protein VipA/TviB [Candidatus Neomarinimicrobiota bacterium]